MAQRKDFPSLRKVRLGGVSPQNRLTAPAHRITIPNINTINRGALYVVKPLSVDDKERSQDVKTCFYLTVALQDTGLAEPPRCLAAVSHLDYNGTKIHASGNDDLVLSVLQNGRFLFFKKDVAFIDKMALPEMSVTRALFDADNTAALFVLAKDFGYIAVVFQLAAPQIFNFLHSEKGVWLDSLHTVSATELQQKHAAELARRENAHRDPQTVYFDDAAKLSPKVTSRQIRMSARLARDESSIDYGQSSDEELEPPSEDVEQIIVETPAPFDPPLRHSINDQHFIISYNDFKTLYNNDWINDTLIDFFIAMEIDHAINTVKLVRSDQVYAFNSFFFTKLFSKLDNLPPDYYANIRRWLLKIDLMSYDSVVIPINEHLHWYLVVMKNLPRLLEYAKGGGLLENAPKLVDVYVIDSLRQLHSNISAPFKTMISQYCEDKHGVKIPPSCIRFLTPRVPRQRNFNDCGLHVIYNLRKWLFDPAFCEVQWLKKNKCKTYFSRPERNNMRKSCINILLELHGKQPENTVTQETQTENHSDDEIQEISYHTRPEAKEPSAEGTGEAQNGESTSEKIASGESTKKETSSVVPHKNGINGENGGDVRQDVEPPRESLGNEGSPKSERKPKKTSYLFQAKNGFSTPIKRVTRSSSESRTYVVKLRTVKKTPESSTSLRTLDPRVVGTHRDASSPEISIDLGVIETSSPKDSERATSQHKERKHEALNGKLDFGKERNAKKVVEHPQIRRLCLLYKLQPATTSALNEIFFNHAKTYSDEKQRKILEFVERHNRLESLHRQQVLEQNLKEALRNPPAPMDEPFVIQDADDSGSELNKSVGDLRILSLDVTPTDRVLRKRRSPEASRNFLVESHSQTPTRTTRRNSSRQSSSSDLEILDNVEILSDSHSGPASPQSIEISSRESLLAQKEGHVVISDEEENFPPESPRNTPKRRRVETRYVQPTN